MKIVFLPTLLLLVNFLQAQTDLKQGLIAYYPFNGNANDESGNNHNPSVVKATFTSDRFGKTNSASEFNGTSNFIRIPDNKAFHFTSGFSISAWVMIKGFYGGPCHGNRILMKGSLDLPYSGNYMLGFDDNHYTRGANCSTKNPDRAHQSFYGIYDAIISNEYVIPNKWYLLTYVFDGSYASLYVDCNLHSKGNAKDQHFSNNEDLFLGKMNNAQYPYWYNGLLDELRIYNRPLNKNEISALCNKIPETASKPIICTGENAVSAKFDYTISQCTSVSFKLSTANTKQISKILWSFGDGSTSGKLSASHLYKKPGTYTIKTIVTGRSGCADTAVRQIEIKKLNTDFTFNEQNSPGSFRFKTIDKNVTYSWDMGDNTEMLNDANVTHSYTKTGLYTIQLFAQSSTGCRDTVKKSINVALPEPQVTPVTKPVDTQAIPPVVAKPQLVSREKEIIKTISVETDSVNISLYDNGIIDGDSITLIYNDEIILTHQLLSDKPIKLSLKINPNRQSNELVMYAENLGSIPPNTALVVIIEGKNRHELNLSSNQQKNQAISFIIKR
ncbi:PKD domain-containing protein [Niastella sp. OAS944]|uniref:LamG domain-containing protein n=1 Tax=Niastella sp. OAS944 TaxID=2664089 RepID=UPI0034984A34|nr:PKD repeat protein [Chitinophagaceae bacterium OAS944]